MRTKKFSIKYSHNVIDHLGLKLYQNKPTNVIAELVSNSWDANAENVWIDIETKTEMSERKIIISDDGYGMSEHDLLAKYLVIGKTKKIERDKDNEKKRRPMGRKGIGKLAPFGVAKKIIVFTVHNSLMNCFELDYEKMIGTNTTDDGISTYHPKEIIRQVKLTSDIDQYFEEKSDAVKIKNFISKIKSSGTLVLCKNLTLKNLVSKTTA